MKRDVSVKIYVTCLLVLFPDGDDVGAVSGISVREREGQGAVCAIIFRKVCIDCITVA